MSASPSGPILSNEARNLHWLLDNLVEEVPGVRSIAVVSSDGLLLLSSDPDRARARARARHRDVDRVFRHGVVGGGPGGDGPLGSSADLATIVSGIGSLTLGAAKLMEAGAIRQTMVAMDQGTLFIMSISDGSLLGVHAAPDCDISVIVYHMALFVGRAGHVLTPELRTELRLSMELEKQ